MFLSTRFRHQNERGESPKPRCKGNSLEIGVKNFQKNKTNCPECKKLRDVNATIMAGVCGYRCTIIYNTYFLRRWPIRSHYAMHINCNVMAANRAPLDVFQSDSLNF